MICSIWGSRFGADVAAEGLRVTEAIWKDMPRVIPETVILLANLGLPRRSAGSATRRSEPVLRDGESATRQLAALISGPVTDRDLPAVRRVHQAAVGAATALLAGAPVDCPAISALAHRSTGRLELAADGDRTLRRRLVWEDPASPERIRPRGPRLKLTVGMYGDQATMRARISARLRRSTGANQQIPCCPLASDH